MSQTKFSVLPPSAGSLTVNGVEPSLFPGESLSALVDGELDDQALDALLEACQQDESALGSWSRYQLIGEVLRSPAQTLPDTAVDAQLAFVSRLGQRLAQEAETKSEVPAPAAPAWFPFAATLAHQRGPASNDSHFYRKLALGVASLAAISVVAWSVAGLLVPVSEPQVAQASSAPVLVTSPQGPMLRNARLQEMLAAHKQFGATSALQEPSGFLRNATFETSQEAVSGH